MLMYPRLCLQVGSAKWLRTYLTNQYVILRYCSPNLRKQNYLYGNLPFYKIQVNHFMAWDELSGSILSFKITELARGFNPKSVLRQDTLLLYSYSQSVNEKKGMF